MFMFYFYSSSVFLTLKLNKGAQKNHSNTNDNHNWVFSLYDYFDQYTKHIKSSVLFYQDEIFFTDLNDEKEKKYRILISIRVNFQAELVLGARKNANLSQGGV